METEVDRATLSLNGFLLRPGVTPITAPSLASESYLRFYLVSQGQLQPLDVADYEIVEAAGHGDLIFALSRRPSGAPAWQRFLWDELNLGPLTAGSESLGAIVFCAIGEETSAGERLRWIAWTFGSGSRSLLRAAQDPRFGLMVVLNLLTEQAAAEQTDAPVSHAKGPRMRELRYRSPAPYVQQTGHRAARDIPVDGFRIDRSTDLVAAVGSTGAVPVLATSTLLGGRSLRFRTQVGRLEDLTALAEIALAQSKLRRYREEFTWIDNITPVEDEATIQQLRAHLAETLATDPNPASIDAILPDDLLDVGDDRSISTIAFPRERGATHGRPTLTTAMLAAVVGKVVDPEERNRMLDTELRFFDDAGQKIGQASILECLSAEFRIGDAHYVAYDGDFYIADNDYVKRIDHEIAQIPTSQLNFPSYHAETEPLYNAKVGRELPAEFINLDRALIKIPGETTFEACDLLAATGALVHVKRKGRSSTLSHLFLQAANSCELLRRSPEARRQFHKLIAERSSSPQVLARVQSVLATAENSRDELEIVFAFLGDWKDRTITSLPLFSRISLVNESRRVRNLGYRVTVKTLSHR
jgi:uncharacterized protein (TIGR04141 family)